MRNLIYLMTAVSVMGLAFWAYGENYRTRSSLDRMERLQGEIAGLREGLGVLRSEWAYLNRPDRLRELANLNFERLALLPLAPEQFGALAQVAHPVPDLPLVLDPVDTAARPEVQP